MVTTDLLEETAHLSEEPDGHQAALRNNQLLSARPCSVSHDGQLLSVNITS